jgi:hypothetical protein
VLVGQRRHRQSRVEVPVDTTGNQKPE